MSTAELSDMDNTSPGPFTTEALRKSTIYLSKSSLSQTAKRLLIFLLPTFLQSSYDPRTPSNQPHPTAWLDGMRGIAGLLVFLYHLSYSTHDVYTAYIPSHKDFLRDEHPCAKRGLFRSHGELCLGCYNMVGRYIHTGCGCAVSTIRQMAGGKMRCEEADKGRTCVERRRDRVAESPFMPSSDS